MVHRPFKSPFFEAAATALVVIASTLLISSASASVLEAKIHYERDNLTLYRGRTEASWLSDETGTFNLRIAAHGTTAGGNWVQGIPGGWRGYGGAHVTGILSVPPLELRVLGGIENAILVDSWCGDISVRLSPEALAGFSAKVAVASRWLDGWFTHRIRSSSVSGAINYESKETWAEIGAIWDERSSARQPPIALRLDLRNNRLATVYGWWSHELAGWLVAGFSAKWSSSRLDFHQPTLVENGVFRYADYPYTTPHFELTWATQLEVRISSLRLNVNWPVASEGSYRVDDPYSLTPTFYRGRDMAIAELRASVGLALSEQLSLKCELVALSRPYRSHAWFTNDSWNQVGLNFVLQHRTNPSES